MDRTGPEPPTLTTKEGSSSNGGECLTFFLLFLFFLYNSFSSLSLPLSLCPPYLVILISVVSRVARGGCRPSISPLLGFLLRHSHHCAAPAPVNKARAPRRPSHTTLIPTYSYGTKIRQIGKKEKAISPFRFHIRIREEKLREK